MNTTFLEQTTVSQIGMESLVYRKDSLDPIDIQIVDFEDLDPNNKSTAIEMLADEFCQHMDNGYQMMERKLYSDNSDPVCIFSENKIIGVGNVTYHDYNLLREQLFYRYENTPLPKNLLIGKFGELTNAEEKGIGYVAELDYSVVARRYRGLGLGTILFEYRLQKIIDSKFTDVVFVLTKSPLAGKAEYWKSILNQAQLFGNIDPNNFFELYGFDNPVKPFNFLWGSPQITKLAIRHKFAPIGFSKNLSPLWIKTLEN